MKFGEKVKSLIKEAELYRTQGLLSEALDAYKNVQVLIESTQNVKNKDTLLKKIANKIDALYSQMEVELSVKPPPRVSEDAQSVIKDMIPEDDPEAKGSSSLAGALALAKFGQYDQAIEELTRLISNESLRFEAAKNIIWCWIQQGEVDKALARVKQWMVGNLLTLDEVNNVRSYFEELVRESGLDSQVSKDKIQKNLEPDSEVEDEDILDINSTRFKIPRGARQGEPVELEISFQAGKYLKILVAKKERQLIESLNVGDQLTAMTFYSPMAIFSGTGYVSSKVMINAGPKKGDYSLEIKILNIQT